MIVNRRRFLSRTLAAGAAISLPCRGIFADCHEASHLDLAHDPRRPQYHLLPRQGWMNDPNGPIYWHGQYHMFYQANPDGPCMGAMRWGHAVSPDMLHWRHMPVALSPTPGGPDALGCWSGTTVVDQGTVTAIYTGIVHSTPDRATLDGKLRESQCLAWSTDPDLRTWQKLPQHVIPAPPPGLKITGFRDPSPWRQGDTWYTVIASGFPGQGGALLLYRSPDLRHWEYMHVLARGAPVPQAPGAVFNSGDTWECPEIFPLGGKHVLIYSTRGLSRWQVGTLDENTMLFHAEQTGVLDYGLYYAAKSQLDAHGNRIVWGWIGEQRAQPEMDKAGWAGMMSLPRQLGLDADGRLTMQVAPVVESLRGQKLSFTPTKDEQQNQARLRRMQIENVCGEVLCVTRPGGKPFCFTLTGIPQAGPEQTWLEVSYDPGAPRQVRIGDTVIPVALQEDKLEIHIYVDGSAAEVILNRQAVLTQRFYYPGMAAPATGVRAGNIGQIVELTMWQMLPVSPNRLTS